MPSVSIVIATNRPPDALRPALRALAAQTLPASQIEVVVAFNGMPAAPPRADDWPFALRSVHIPAANVGAARNRAFELCRGDLVLLVNDDVLLAPDAGARHLQAHAALGRNALVLGRADWRRYPDETVFDRMIRTSSLVFFYDRMPAAGWFGFRHCWTLNLSLPRALCARVRFDERLAPVNFDDLEWGWRLEHEHAARVWYDPNIHAVHDHRYTLEGFLRREAHLGEMAWKLAQANPACFEAIYRQPPDGRLLAEYELLVAADAPRERALTAQLAALAARPAASLPHDPPAAGDFVAGFVAGLHPLRRLVFRRALLQAATEPALA